MIKLTMLLVLFFPFGSTLSAQDEFPKWEFYWGFTYARVDAPGLHSPRSGYGLGSSMNLNVHKYFGFTAELAGHNEPSGCVTWYQCFEQSGRDRLQDLDLNYSSIQFLFGPRLTLRADRGTLFVHALAGGVRTRVSRFTFSTATQEITVSGPDFAMGLGGGLDFRVSRWWAFRAFQLDYIPVWVGGSRAGSIRLQLGFVVNWGRPRRTE